jgi:uncharacterized membrane protein YfcA
MDWTIYWFMFPLAIGVTTTASLCGIGGPALFTPIFIILFPLLGPEYLLQSAVAAFGAALLTQCFGFTSAFFGYYRRRLIDFKTAIPFAAVGVPLGIIGALLAQAVDDNLLKAGYAILMLVLAAVMLRRQDGNGDHTSETNTKSDEHQRIVDRDGTVYEYPRPRQGIGMIFTGMGALLTGMVSVGIGEVMMPQLIKRHRIPVPVAAGTSVMVAIIVVIACSVTLTAGLVARGGLAAVPWNLVCYTIPGVIIGGQVGPRLQGRFDQASMVKFISSLFIAIGAAMLWVVLA